MKAGKSDLPSPQELFAEVVGAAVNGNISVQRAADLIGDAVASITYHRLEEIGLLTQFEDCAFAIRHVVIGIASAKLVEMKRIAAYGDSDAEES
jgi:hypothetical protein